MSNKNEIKISAITNEMLEYLVAMPVNTVTTVGVMLHEQGFENLDNLDCMDIAIRLSLKAREVGIAMDYISHWNKAEGLIHNLDFVKRNLIYVPDSCFTKLEFNISKSKDDKLEGCIDIETASFIIRRNTEDYIFELSETDENRIIELMMKEELPSKSVDYNQDSKGKNNWQFLCYEQDKDPIIISGKNDIEDDSFNEILAIIGRY